MFMIEADNIFAMTCVLSALAFLVSGLMGQR